MLNRKDAKTKACPYQVALGLEISLKSIAAGMPEKELEERLEQMCHCKVEHCPKWRNSLQELWCSKQEGIVSVKDCPHGFNHVDLRFIQAFTEYFNPVEDIVCNAMVCNSCEYRIGYCGG